jgi:DNA-binding NarL/FixJ family response regulator
LTQKRWDEKDAANYSDDDRLREWAGTLTTAQIAKELDRTEDAVRVRASELGVSLRTPDTPAGAGQAYSEREQATIRALAGSRTAPEIAEIIGRSAASIRQWCSNNGVSLRLHTRQVTVTVPASVTDKDVRTTLKEHL